jgi:hypothetical protein
MKITLISSKGTHLGVPEERNKLVSVVIKSLLFWNPTNPSKGQASLYPPARIIGMIDPHLTFRDDMKTAIMDIMRNNTPTPVSICKTSMRNQWRTALTTHYSPKVW